MAAAYTTGSTASESGPPGEGIRRATLADPPPATVPDDVSADRGEFLGHNAMVCASKSARHPRRFLSTRMVVGRVRRRGATLCRRARHRLARAGRQVEVLPMRPAVLMYHRIATDPVDPWGLAVTPSRFNEQLQWLKEHRTVLPLPEFARLLRSSSLSARAVAITFDDGYACNATTAAPLLEAHRVPATIFVTTGPIIAGEEFWWDDLQRIVFGASTERLNLTVDVPHLSVELGGPLGGDAAWLSGSAPGNTRQQAFMELWLAVRCLEPPAQAAALAELRDQAGMPVEPRESHRPMTVEQLKKLSRSNFVDVGCHTRTHPALTERPEAVQRAEIAGGRQACANLTGRLPSTFAYPFGDYDPATVELVREAGFEAGCTTDSAAVTPGCDLLALPRLQVEDWSADELARKLRAL